jgi:hypothetical protein
MLVAYIWLYSFKAYLGTTTTGAAGATTTGAMGRRTQAEAGSIKDAINRIAVANDLRFIIFILQYRNRYSSPL